MEEEITKHSDTELKISKQVVLEEVISKDQLLITINGIRDSIVNYSNMIEALNLKLIDLNILVDKTVELDVKTVEELNQGEIS